MTQLWAKKSSNTQRHTVYKCACHGKRIPGGSTIAGCYQPYGAADYLMRWAIKEDQEGRDPFAVRDEAGKFGTCIHLHWECSVTGEPFPAHDFPPAYVEIAEKSTARITEYAVARGYRPLHLEHVVISNAHHFGGTVDLTWVKKDGDPRELILSDLKGSARVSINHLIQVHGGYDLALLEQHPEFTVVGRELLRLDRDTGELEPHEWGGDYARQMAAAARDMFLACLTNYERAKALKKFL